MKNLNSLLISKQNNLMNQMHINNNININPLMFQQNVIMNIPQMDMNPIQNPIFQNNLNEIENTNDKNDIIINVSFIHVSGKHTVIWCKPNEKMLEIIKKYRQKANDFDEYDVFLYNAKKIDPSLTLYDIIGRLQTQITIDIIIANNVKCRNNKNNF